MWLTKADHTATPDTTKLSCLCRVHFGGVNWIPDNSRLSPTENLRSEHVNSNYPIHTTTPFVILMTNTWRIKRCIIITTQTRLFCRVWCGGVNWVGPTARQVRSVSALCRSASGGAVRPLDALRHRTHLSVPTATPSFVDNVRVEFAQAL